MLGRLGVLSGRIGVAATLTRPAAPWTFQVPTGYVALFTLNPKKYGKTFTVQLRAYDLAGNVGTSSKRTCHR